MTDKIVVFSSCANAADAEVIARALVERQLAACVTVVGHATSFYQWKGALEKSAECLLLIKTSRECFAELKTEMEKIHPYEVPEILALQVVEGSENYLNWMDLNLRAAGRQ